MSEAILWAGYPIGVVATFLLLLRYGEPSQEYRKGGWELKRFNDMPDFVHVVLSLVFPFTAAGALVVGAACLLRRGVARHIDSRVELKDEILEAAKREVEKELET